MPSSPMRQTCSKTVGPSPVRCSVNWMERRWDLPINSGQPPLALDQRQVAQVVVVKFDQVEGVQHRFLATPFAPQRMEVRCPVVAGDHGLAVDQERVALMRSAASTMAGKRSAQS